MPGSLGIIRAHSMPALRFHQNCSYICAPMKQVNQPENQPERAWYEEWFDSPYYHRLYQYRDEAEAKRFIDQLLNQLQPPPRARILDLACGRGRFSRYLAAKGFEVTGLDLSQRSIEYARQFESERLSFYTHDMRLPFRTNYFDYVFNFFTSFGYFNSERDDLKTLRNIALGLKKDGVFVLDFFNTQYVIDHLTGAEVKQVDGISFAIQKQIQGQRVVKTINFEDEGRPYFFRESVRLFRLEDFKRLFRQAGLKITIVYGDYQLHSYDEQKSPRLILVAQLT